MDLDLNQSPSVSWHADRNMTGFDASGQGTVSLGDHINPDVPEYTPGADGESSTSDIVLPRLGLPVD